jgi:hypothetical protein
MYFTNNWLEVRQNNFLKQMSNRILLWVLIASNFVFTFIFFTRSIQVIKIYGDPYIENESSAPTDLKTIFNKFRWISSNKLQFYKLNTEILCARILESWKSLTSY